ncbi:unnamed protein product [Phytophthora fragariaefolia]|uniref:Unnamed protein product n=1 Tax=Phytophthora fragariaefolia TaxID=1490495 RepID=A0A9W6WUY9_9STRA|nr:unnamed protein product [Phytophthora fragariaefolia]
MDFGALQGRGNAGNQLVQQPVQQQQVQQEGQAPQRRQAVRKVAAGTKAPKYDYDGGFDLYRARLESYLRQRDCWNVVIGTEAHDPQNAAQQQNYEERNLFARDALLFGLLPKDAKKLCKLARVSEMWTAYERDKTQRDFANSIRIRAKMYGAKFVKGMQMDKYLEDLEDYRRQLENMNDRIGDAEMASITLTGVEGTHRNVVRMFNRDANPPDLERVLNYLRSEAEMDEAEAENTDTSKKKKDEGDKMIGSVKGKRVWQGKKQNKVGPGKKA